jgi:hypothetical protein
MEVILMVRNLKGVFIVLIFAGFIAGCSKSSTTSSNNTSPTLTAPTFSGPTSTSATKDTSGGYLEASTTAQIFNATASGYLGYYAGQKGTQNGGNWSWTYSVQGFTATWTATASSSGYDWKLVYNGTLTTSSSSITFNNWTVVNGSESNGGKNGSWTIYYPNTTFAVFQVNWSTDGSGNLNGTIVSSDTTGGSVPEKFMFTNNKDKSGSLEVYQGTNFTVQTWDITWTSAGSGQYTEWDDTHTNVIASGTWS